MESLIGILYLTALVGFVVFGLHRLLLLATFFRHRRKNRSLKRVPLPVELPLVCIQCPIFNEPLVVEELLDAVTAIEWDERQLEVQILDDSTDETPEIVERWLEAHPGLARRCRHICRADRRGFKAGALAEGFRQSRAEFFAILDADFRPRPDFLWQLMPLFSAPRIGAIQARWEFTNRRHSLLTRLQAVFLDAHFLIEQSARSSAGFFFNFNGTAGIWRRAAIQDVGGWSSDTVTEDLDLCYRAQMRGWRMVYENNYPVPSELPEGVAAFKSQQRRWTKGGVQVFRKFIGRILRSDLPVRTKIEAFFHLGVGFIHIFLVLFAITLVPALLNAGAIPSGFAAVLHPLVIVAGTGATLAFYLSGQYFREGRVGHGLLTILAAPVVMAFGLAMCVTCCFAVIEGLVADGGEFVRTPKGGARVRANPRLRHSIARAGLAFVTAVEIVLGTLLAAASIHFAHSGSAWIAATLALKSSGFFALGICSLNDFGWRGFWSGLPGWRAADPAR